MTKCSIALNHLSNPVLNTVSWIHETFSVDKFKTHEYKSMDSKDWHPWKKFPVTACIREEYWWTCDRVCFVWHWSATQLHYSAKPAVPLLQYDCPNAKTERRLVKEEKKLLLVAIARTTLHCIWHWLCCTGWPCQADKSSPLLSLI